MLSPWVGITSAVPPGAYENGFDDPIFQTSRSAPRARAQPQPRSKPSLFGLGKKPAPAPVKAAPKPEPKPEPKSRRRVAVSALLLRWEVSVCADMLLAGTGAAAALRLIRWGQLNLHGTVGKADCRCSGATGEPSNTPDWDKDSMVKVRHCACMQAGMD